MIRIILALVLFSFCSWSEDEMWALTTNKHKDVKLNGVVLKKAQTWEFPSWTQLATGDTEAMLFLSGRYYLKLEPQTQIRWQDSNLHLDMGRVYIKTMHSDLNLVINGFFKFKITSPDLVVHFDKEIKRTEFQVLTQNQNIQIDSDDREIPVVEGTKLVFEPEYVEGELAYDFLLNDRKIPRFHIEKTRIEKPAVMDVSQWKLPLKKAMAQKKKVTQKAKVDNIKNICKKPSGALNSCLFVAEEKSCIRYSCNLSGEWSQKTVFEKNEFCPKTKTVKDCLWLGR